MDDFVRELRKAAETGIDGNVKNLLHKINIKYKVCDVFSTFLNDLSKLFLSPSL